MIKSHKNIIHVESTTTPVVELDSAAHAAYIRFSSEKVKKTVVVDVDHCLVTMDVSEAGKVIGVELIGVAEFSIDKLIKKARVTGVSPEMMRNARYVPANAEPMALSA
jgi:uncharacterized protein YuzE